MDKSTLADEIITDIREIKDFSQLTSSCNEIITVFRAAGLQKRITDAIEHVVGFYSNPNNILIMTFYCRLAVIMAEKGEVKQSSDFLQIAIGVRTFFM